MQIRILEKLIFLELLCLPAIRKNQLVSVLMWFLLIVLDSATAVDRIHHVSSQHSPYEQPKMKLERERRINYILIRTKKKSVFLRYEIDISSSFASYVYISTNPVTENNIIRYKNLQIRNNLEIKQFR